MTMHTMAAAGAALVLHLLAVSATRASSSQPSSSSSSPPPPPPSSSDISSCLLSNGVTNFSLPSSPSYTPLLHSSIRNLRFENNNPNITKPTAIVLPSTKLHLQHTIICARTASLAIRVRSGGHSYEGLSYTTENHVAFLLIDLSSLNRVDVDVTSATAWAESGATLGQLYHAVGLLSNSTLAFSAGSCPTVGSGGHISGGGFGLLSRKYGLAADNVLDAVVVTANGDAVTRDTMHADVFWAIRGGGGGGFGVVYAWKVRLVTVPDTVTVFTVRRTGPAELVTGLMHRWQFVGPSLPDEFYLSTYIPTRRSSDGNHSISFTGQVLGPKRLAMSVLSQSFPELNLAESELSEVSWLEAAVKFAGVSTADELTSRQPGVGQYSKSKSDYVRSPISMQDAIRIVRFMSTAPVAAEGSIQLDPYGGAMARIGSTVTPFPHRAGYLYSIQYGVSWEASDGDRADEYVGWLRSFYGFMAPYVSKNPRAAYVNYLDLDLGSNGWMNATGGASSDDSVRHAAAAWGKRYFSMNFGRLVRAKTLVDPGNVFNNAQSIPPSYFGREH